MRMPKIEMQRAKLRDIPPVGSLHSLLPYRFARFHVSPSDAKLNTPTIVRDYNERYMEHAANLIGRKSIILIERRSIPLIQLQTIRHHIPFTIPGHVHHVAGGAPNFKYPRPPLRGKLSCPDFNCKRCSTCRYQIFSKIQTRCASLPAFKDHSAFSVVPFHPRPTERHGIFPADIIGQCLVECPAMNQPLGEYFTPAFN